VKLLIENNQVLRLRQNHLPLDISDILALWNNSPENMKGESGVGMGKKEKSGVRDHGWEKKKWRGDGFNNNPISCCETVEKFLVCCSKKRCDLPLKPSSNSEKTIYNCRSTPSNCSKVVCDDASSFPPSPQIGQEEARSAKAD
jgi:hypothetical protein